MFASLGYDLRELMRDREASDTQLTSSIANIWNHRDYRYSELRASIAPDANASDLLRILAESGHRQLPVIDASGTFHGFVTVQGVLRWAAFDREKLLANFSAKR